MICIFPIRIFLSFFLFLVYFNIMKISHNQIFFLDSAGALLTAFLTAVILTQFHVYFGMPVNECYVLGAVAVLFSIYSLVCAIRLKKNHAPFLKFIAITNGIYCLITTGFVIYHYPGLTKWGVAYFVIETLVVAFVIALEWRTAEDLAAE